MKKKILFIFIIILAVSLSLILYQQYQQTHKDTYYLEPKVGYNSKILEIIKENGLESKIVDEKDYKGIRQFYLKLSDSEFKRLSHSKGFYEYLNTWIDENKASPISEGPAKL